MLNYRVNRRFGHACSQFHQHFTREFYVRKCFAQLFSSYVFFFGFVTKEKLREALLYKKIARKMLMKLTLDMMVRCYVILKAIFSR